MCPKILIVDDDQDVEPLLRQAFKKELAKGLFDFVFAFSSEEALQYLNAASDATLILILSDIHMPGKNGLLLLKEIKQKNSELPVFLYTAYDDESKRQIAAKYKADKFISKPIDFNMLRQDIFALINKS